MKRSIKLFLSSVLLLGLASCASVPKGFLKPSEKSLETRQLQMRHYDTTDENKIISAVAGVLQDLGFTLDESETKLGLVSASKNNDATDKGQVTLAFLADFLAAMGGSYSNNLSQVDAIQKVKASVVAKRSLDRKGIVTRVTFQRIVWNASNQINKVETVNEPAIYQKFFDSLSKSIFLEAHKL